MTAALTQRLRDATRDLHTAAERAGLMPALLRGDLPREDYVRLLRNLHALYTTLEDRLERHAGHPCIAPLRVKGLERGAALAADLDALHGSGWQRLPLAAAMRAYCGHLDALAQAETVRLAAHVYVRYLGDLSGGQLLRGIVARSFGLAGEQGTAFYAFGSEADVRALKAALKAGLDSMRCNEAQQVGIVDEARDSFARHVALFEELAPAVQPSRSLPAA